MSSILRVLAVVLVAPLIVAAPSFAPLGWATEGEQETKAGPGNSSQVGIGQPRRVVSDKTEDVTNLDAWKRRSSRTA